MMSDYFEIDFLDIKSSKSGDAITIRYQVAGKTAIHAVDGGFQYTGDSVVEHINKYYNSPVKVDRVVVTHPDGDHAGGLRKVLEEFDVGELWMLRPWLYADELIDRFSRFKSVENLATRLREIYPNIDVLEKIANDKRIPIYEPFQGALIGEFTVMAPKKSRYLDLVVESEKTPEVSKEKERAALNSIFEAAVQKAMYLWKALWGEENFSNEDTSAENEMSVVQFASICKIKILLTGDAGRSGLSEAAKYAPFISLQLPGIDRFQVPHHGSRRNVSTEILDTWLGPQLEQQLVEGEEKFTAIISAAKQDEHHPRKAVVRSVIHRGARAVSTEGVDLRTSYNAPKRDGWTTAKPIEYPAEQEK